MTINSIFFFKYIYIYIGIILCILLYIFKWIYAFAWSEKLVALKAMNNETLIYFPNKLERVGWGFLWQMHVASIYWFIFKEFYFIFLILESNMGLHHKYSSKWVIKYTKTKESKINESLKKKKSASQ